MLFTSVQFDIIRVICIFFSIRTRISIRCLVFCYQCYSRGIKNNLILLNIRLHDKYDFLKKIFNLFYCLSRLLFMKYIIILFFTYNNNYTNILYNIVYIFENTYIYSRPLEFLLMSIKKKNIFFILYYSYYGEKCVFRFFFFF